MLTFAELLDPITIAGFFTDVWEGQTLHLRRSNRGYYDALLNVGEIETQLFGNQNLTVTRFRMYRGAEELSPAQWSDQSTQGSWSSNTVDPNKVLGAFRQGYSLYLHFAETMFPRLGRCLSGIERELKLQAVSHLIVTPPNSHGLLPHSDPYGVVILQLSGAKTWLSYGVQPGSAKGQGRDFHDLSTQAPRERFELTAGDLLYLPRGVVHAVSTTHTHSIHLSIGLRSPTGLDLVKLIEGLTGPEAFFQESVPYGACSEDLERRRIYEQQFKERLKELIDRTDLFELLDRRHSTRLRLREPVGSLHRFFSLEEVDMQARVRVRRGVGFALGLEPRSGKCVLSFDGTALEFPGQWLEGLHDLFAAGEFLVCEFGAGLPITAADRLQVARNLLHSGFLEIV